MTAEEMRTEFYALYDKMAGSQNVEYMHVFGSVHKEMMEWMILNKPDLAQEWLDRLASIKWHNHLTRREAENILTSMAPAAPWKLETWKSEMLKHGFSLEDVPYYNQCALYVVMSMIYSDSIDTLNKYVGDGDVFEMIHDLALDKLEDADRRFNVRRYFGL